MFQGSLSIKSCIKVKHLLSKIEKTAPSFSLILMLPALIYVIFIILEAAEIQIEKKNKNNTIVVFFFADVINIVMLIMLFGTVASIMSTMVLSKGKLRTKKKVRQMTTTMMLMVLEAMMIKMVITMIQTATAKIMMKVIERWIL